ncbi:6976_t:CDS:1 [Ambispora gerdemannii]|uniref:6976_t:CDS:1 n=1 Tax=Ambispora gerdemannii TaxID=144530 RepID=A0A9N8YMY7_9GLOM|nr:6976_t:CDS:1 [Ambispora gerdemannii]
MSKNPRSYQVKNQTLRKQIKARTRENFKATYKDTVHHLLEGTTRNLPYQLTMTDLEELLDLGKRVTGTSEKLPRPQNAWVLYRKFMGPRVNVTGDTLSKTTKIVSARWKNESKEVKELFKSLAQTSKQAHKIAFPNYRYNPVHKKTGNKGTFKLRMDSRVTQYALNGTTPTTNNSNESKSVDMELSTPIVPSQPEGSLIQNSNSSITINNNSELNHQIIYDQDCNIFNGQVPNNNNEFQLNPLHSTILAAPDPNLLELNVNDSDSLHLFPEDYVFDFAELLHFDDDSFFPHYP